MGETHIVRFPGSLDPGAQEFRPRNNNCFTPQGIPVFGQPPPPPPPPPPQQVCYPYGHHPGVPPPFGGCHHHDTGGRVVAGYHGQCSALQPQAQPYLNTGVRPFPPQTAVPTRALLLSSVPADVSESIIRRELEVFGEVRGVLMERVREGLVTVYFYDLRHAEKALMEIRDQHMQHQARINNLFISAAITGGGGGGETSLQRLALAPPTPAPGLILGFAVWAQFVMPSCTAVPDGQNQGTIVVFNLEPSVSTSCLREIFQCFGDVKEVRETPMKKQQRFVEFYDIRDAARALREMDGKEIHGKPAVIEFSRPGGYCKKYFYTAGNPAECSTKFSKYGSTPSVVTSRFSSPRFSSSSTPPPPPLPLLPRLSTPVQSSAKNSFPYQERFYQGNPNINEVACSDNGLSIHEASASASVSGLSLGVVGIVEKSADQGTTKRNPKKGQSSMSDLITRGNTTATKQQQRKSKPWKGKQKKMDNRFLISEAAMVESNLSDTRTTVMIKNIPNKYSQKLLLNMLDNHCIHCNEQIADGDDQPLSAYDFLYLPIDFNNKCNVGYGFVNMTSPQAAWRLYKAFHHQHWEVFNSRKICEVTYARVQGLEALRDHFKNSKFPHEMDHYMPVVFSPPRDGRQLTEPHPIFGHKHQQQQQQQQPVKSSPANNMLEEDMRIGCGSSLKDSNEGGSSTDDGDPEGEEEEEEEESLNCRSSGSGGHVGNNNNNNDDKDSGLNRSCDRQVALCC